MTTIEWHNDTRKLGALTPWADNPAEISEAEAARLLESLRDFGQVATIAIEPDGVICDGHQRRQVWAAAREYGPDYEVAVRVASRKLTRKEREKLAVLLRTAQGHFNWDALAAWDANELQGWGLDAETLRGWDDAAANLREMLAAEYVAKDGEDVDYDEHWQGMPEFEQENGFGAIHTLKVHFATQEDIAKFSQIINQQVNEKTVYIWFPKLEDMNLKAYRVLDESKIPDIHTD